MKKKRLIDIESAQASYHHCLGELYLLLKPYFSKIGKLDLLENNLETEISMWLSGVLNNIIAIEDNENAVYFCADDILPKQIVMENDNLMKFWGIIYWLETPLVYPINKTNQDPFYAEFDIINDSLNVKCMKFGDYKTRNIDKIDWFEIELDWIYVFHYGVI